MAHLASRTGRHILVAVSVVAALCIVAFVSMLAKPASPAILMDRFPQPMLAEIPGRGLVEIVPEISGPQFRQQMLVSGVECKQHCYDNFIMCGDHRAETSNKLTQWNYADATKQCRFLKDHCESMC